MRIKSHWFRSERPKSPEEIAGAAAFIAWRIGQDALKTLRAAGYDLPPGPRYFAFVTEILVFLALGADRIAYRHGDPDWRVAFTTAITNRVGEILAENESDLVGRESAGDIKRRFVERVNACAVECADLAWDDDGPGYGFLRYLGHQVGAVMDERDRTWAISQVIEVEGPNAAAHLARGMKGLLDPAPRRRDRGAHARGE